ACWKLDDFKKLLEKNPIQNDKMGYGEMASTKERMTLDHKDGKKVWVETIYTPTYDQENGDIAYVMGVIKDITDLKKMEEEKNKLLIELGQVRQELESKYDFSSIVGRSRQILQILNLAAQVAKQNTTVMLLGESGTGKEILAKAIHYNSPRASKPFVALNCSAFPDTLIESELFGYEKGAFTGADKSKLGKIQLASGGTFFLDEVTEMSAPAQAKILRVIQEREYEPLGSVKTMRVDLRVIAATNKNLEQLVEEGKFRNDLYYRLCVYPICIPPLRERKEDIPILMDYFLDKLGSEMGKQINEISPQAEKILIDYNWFGNVRELQNVMERLLILSLTGRVEVSDLPRYMIEADQENSRSIPDLGDLSPNFSLEQSVKEFEDQLILQALKKSRYNKTRAAELLGLTRSTFRYKLSKIPSHLKDSA
ncbi:MAG: sigma-54 interaction domain-containing protein, partial [Nitrospinales bacterium]